MEQAGSQAIEQDAEMLADDTQFLTERLSVEPAVDDSQRIEQDVEMPADDTLSLAERRPRRMNRRLPARYRDILPQPPPPAYGSIRLSTTYIGTSTSLSHVESFGPGLCASSYTSLLYNAC